ncbi:MAG: RelA/SpoT domain-containing protein [Alphaproteobacteria bacterium]|nr:RelA/SpoT domain-containing protein [Alphaproteobacteria bacterium]
MAFESIIRRQSNYIPPKYSKSRVNRAGKAFADSKPASEDYNVIENWRTSHAYLLNTFQATLRGKARGKDIIVAQRLKRRPTIIGKLRRFPDMQLSRMHDIAGCRVIFRSIQELNAYRTQMHKARFQHVRKAPDEDRWNYIRNPKPSGYRGIHDVYEYKSKVIGGAPWNGLALEIQYRTQVQHAWATAVEVASLVTHNNPKFDQGSPEVIEFFKLASEVLARAFEDSHGSYSNLSSTELLHRLAQADEETHILRLFDQIRIIHRQPEVQRKNTILVLTPDRNQEGQIHLEIFTFNNIFDATDYYRELESKATGNEDIVLVKSDSMDSIQVAYRNYFGDTAEFTKLLREGREQLELQ